MKNLHETLANLEKTMKTRQAQKSAHNKTADIVQLPVWPEPARGVPNSALRGALFAAIQGKSRRYMDGEILAITKDMQIQ